MPRSAPPATVVVPAGSFNAQFQITANTVSAATSTTVTVSSAGSRASFTVSVTPAAVPAAGSIAAFPRLVAGGDVITITAALQASAPPGGVRVALASDSAALPVPASVVIPAGAGATSFTATAGAVTAATIVHVSETLNAVTTTTQVEIDPARVLTGLEPSAASVDGALGATGGVSISIPTDGTGFSVALHSSNPALAAVPASVAFLSAQSNVTFSVVTTSVSTPTAVTITAAAGGVTKSVDLTVLPTPPPPLDIETLSVAPATLHGSGTATGTVALTTPAPAGGLRVPLSSSDPTAAALPASVLVPAGATSATFPVRVTATSNTIAVGVSALFNNQGPSALLTVTPTRGGTTLVAGNQNQRLAPKSVGDPNGALGFYAGGVGQVESGRMPPGISLINNLRPGEFFFSGTVQKAGTYTFVLEFAGAGAAYAIAYVWVIT